MYEAMKIGPRTKSGEGNSALALNREHLGKTRRLQKLVAAFRFDRAADHDYGRVFFLAGVSGGLPVDVAAGRVWSSYAICLVR